jgi:hypothetical protein
MSMWKTVLQEGFLPGISSKALLALEHALRLDDPRLIQGATTMPPPLQCVLDWPCEGSCLRGFCAWADHDFEASVGQVEEEFARACFDADERVGEKAGCRYLLNWFDETPRDEMRALLLPEIQAELARRCVMPLPEGATS